MNSYSNVATLNGGNLTIFVSGISIATGDTASGFRALFWLFAADAVSNVPRE